MYNLAKSFISYLSSAFTSNPTSKPIREYTRDEITEYFSNQEWKDGGYMNGRYFGFMPPDDKLSVQLKLACRLIHHRFITLSDLPGQLFTPIFFNIIHKNIITDFNLQAKIKVNEQGNEYMQHKTWTRLKVYS